MCLTSRGAEAQACVYKRDRWERLRSPLGSQVPSAYSGICGIQCETKKNFFKDANMALRLTVNATVVG